MSEDPQRPGSPADRWAATWNQFHRLLELEEPARASCLERITAEDATMGGELASLLASHASRHALLDRTEPLCFAAADGPEGDGDDGAPVSRIGDVIGPYRLEEKLGEGGMGVVYLGERVDHEVSQRVAIKLLSGATDAPLLVERFRREREILAHLDHPSIARLIDVGDDAYGRPYVVMEHVEGEPIDAYCRHARLGLRQRLELFVAVCSAVDAAHRGLVVHRDLKPGNVLVTGAGVPKLVDFGIARRLDREDATSGTSSVLTPRWASPEQLRGGPVTTAADIYALGLLLCHLLTGRLPYRCADESLPLLAREILEQAPLAPSTLAAEPGEHYLPAPELRRRLRGDLDTIALHALAKDPAARYRTAADLAADVERYLRGFPIEARSPGPGVRLRKLIARHPFTAAAIAAFAGSVLVFGVITGALNLRLTRSLQRLEVERAYAGQQRLLALRTADFLQDLFRSVAPARARGEEPTVREVLDEGAARLLERDELVGAVDARTRVELLLTLAEVYTSLSELDRATTLAARAEDASRLLGDPFAVADSQAAWARIHHARGEYGKAAALLESALTTYEDSERADSATRQAALLSNLGVARIGLQQDDAAEHALRRALELAGDHETELTAVVRLRLGSLQRRRGNLAASRDLLEIAVRDLRVTSGSDHPETVQARKELADTLRMLGERERAIEILASALGDAERVYGPDHAELAPLLDRLSLLHHERDDAELAERVQRRALAIRELHYDPDSARTTVSVNNLGWLLHDFGRYEEAEALYRRALENGEERLGADHPSVAIALNNLGLLALDRGRPAQAIGYLERSLAVLTERLGRDHPDRAFPLTNLGIAELERGRLAEAATLLREALDLRRKRLPAGHGALTATLIALGRLLCETERAGEGESLLREARSIERAEDRPGSFGEAVVELELGCCLLRRGEREQGAGLIEDALWRIERRRGAGDPRALRARALLAEPDEA